MTIIMALLVTYGMKIDCMVWTLRLKWSDWYVFSGQTKPTMPYDEQCIALVEDKSLHYPIISLYLCDLTIDTVDAGITEQQVILINCIAKCRAAGFGTLAYKLSWLPKMHSTRKLPSSSVEWCLKLYIGEQFNIHFKERIVYTGTCERMGGGFLSHYWLHSSQKQGVTKLTHAFHKIIIKKL